MYVYIHILICIQKRTKSMRSVLFPCLSEDRGAPELLKKQLKQICSADVSSNIDKTTSKKMLLYVESLCGGSACEVVPM